MARPCKYCTSNVNADFDKAIMAGEAVLSASRRCKIPNASADSHAAHVRARMLRPGGGARLPPPTLDGEEVAGTPMEEAAKVCAHLKRKLSWAEQNGVSMKEQAQIAGQLTNANRFHARLCGALDITEGQILKSAPWVRIEKVTLEVLSKYPGAVAAWRKAFDELLGVGE